jgi:hypothetical protein
MEQLLPDASIGGGGGSGNPDSGVAPLSCSHTRELTTYPWGVQVGAYFADRRLTFGILADNTSTATSRLVLEIWPRAGGAEPTFPQQNNFTTADRYKTCETCLLIGEGCTTSPNTCRTYYFAQAGSLRVNEAGRSETAGKLRASGSGIVFAEWSITADAPVANGRCIELNTVAFTGEWGDGGTCSGDSCSSNNPCCADSPYCSLGNNNIGRFCSDFCGESGDGCTGPNDCCDGYKCFLGTCMVDSCGANSCTTGLDEGGGCCDQAAYCVNGSCASACGQANAGCGGDLDCCTGLSCTGGKCI